MHQYEGPIAFAKCCVLKDLLDRDHVNEDIVSFLFTSLMNFRSSHGNDLKVLYRRGALNDKRHDLATA